MPKNTSITATNDKVLRWCKALHGEGLLTNADLNKCTHQFTRLSQTPLLSTSTTVGPNDIKREYGLTSDQLREAVLNPLKYMLDNDVHQTINIEIEGIRVDSETSQLRSLNKLEVPTTFNLINRGNKVGCLLQDMDTGRYVGLKQKTRSEGVDYIALASLTTPDPSSYFRIFSISAHNGDGNNTTHNEDGHRWQLESVMQPGNALTLLDLPINRIILSELGSPRQYFNFTVIRHDNYGSGVDGNTNDPEEFYAEEARARIDDILANINQHRLEYYKLLAMKEFLSGLRDKMLYIVDRNGPVMDYYHQMISDINIRDSEGRLTDNTGDKQRQLQAIQLSIKSELETHEIADIIAIIGELDSKARAYSSGPLATATSKIDRLYRSIDTAIARRNDQIDQLDKVLKKVNKEQQHMTRTLKSLENQQTIDERREIVTTTNDSIVKEHKTNHNLTYWGAIVILVIVFGCIWVFGKELINMSKDVKFN